MKYKFLLFLGLLIPAISFSASPFSDVDQASGNYEAIDYLYKKGIIWWYADWTYKPDRDVNRVEALKILILWAWIDINDWEISLNFKDTDSKAWYAKYLSLWQNLWIVKGYDDGNFKPANTVNLAETLKMLIETNNVNYDKIVTVSPYKDVPQNLWFSAYLQYAKVNSLLNSRDWKAYPAQDINRAEFAEIIFRYLKHKENDQNSSFADFYPNNFEWEKTTSWESYSTNKLTAANRDFSIWTRVKVTNTDNWKSVLVTINDNNLDNPDREIRLSSKAFISIAQMNAKVIPVKLTKISWPITISQDHIEADDNCKYPKERDTIKKDFYKWITLHNPIQAILRENEIYQITWDVSSGIKDVTAVIINDQWKKDIFHSVVDNWFFSLDIDAWSAWEKQIWILPWKSWTYYLWNIDVYKVDCEKNYDTLYSITPNNLSYKIKDNDVYFKWHWTWDLVRLRIKQWNNQVVKYINKKDSYIKLQHIWFKDFAEGDGYFQVSLASSSSQNSFDQDSQWAISENQKIHIIKHHHSFIGSTIENSEIPSTYVFWWKITISWKTKNDIKIKSDIIMPNNKVDSIWITWNKKAIKNGHWTEVYPAETSFSLSYQPKDHWTYIMEVNTSEWLASINIPVYEQWYVPLLPDYSDLFWDIEDIKSIDLNNLRSKIIWLINKDRSLVWLDRIMLNPSLNALAQERANDMVNNNYISHWNQEWKEVNDIKFNYWIKNTVSENLASGMNLEYSHLWLMRSASHRKNILDSQWTRWWFWFWISKDWALITVEIFSASPIKESSISEMRDEFVNTINLKRSKLFTPSLVLHALAQNWTDAMVEWNFFSTSWSLIINWKEVPISINEDIEDSWIKIRDWWTLLMADLNWKWLLERIKEREEIYDDIWDKIWVWIKQDEDWIIMMTVIYGM